MLVNMKDMLEKAKSGKYAVGQFNINNLEWARFILEASEEMKSPVILGVSEGAAKYMGGYVTVANMVKGLISDLNISVPVALHLDHGSSLEVCMKAIDAGFSSVMIDASKKDLNTNISITKEVIDYAKKFNVTVETEVGAIGGQEDDVVADLAYAKVEDALEMAISTKVDFLTPALGSVHGLYKGEPKLDFDKMLEISQKANIPLVLHGGSGIPDDLMRNSIECGICKINLNTELQIVWALEVRRFLSSDETVYDPRKIIKSGESAIKKLVMDKILLFGSNNKI